jgi:hypothetical protein
MPPQMIEFLTANHPFGFSFNTTMESEMELATSSTSCRKETQATATAQPVIPLEGIQTTDVLCGRDKLSHAHIGNKRFRQIIAINREAYQTAPSRENKTSITCDIVTMVREYGGRFLKLDETTGEFQELGEHYIREKVSHALRSAKDPDRPCIRKRREVQKCHVPTPEEDALFQETLRDQQQIFQSLVEREAQGMPGINYDDAENLVISDL